MIDIPSHTMQAAAEGYRGAGRGEDGEGNGRRIEERRGEAMRLKDRMEH